MSIASNAINDLEAAYKAAIANKNSSLTSVTVGQAGAVASAKAALTAAKSAKFQADLEAAATWVKSNWYWFVGVVVVAAVGHVL